jgi:outer membrane receptor for ferrienterochelin and colicin
MFEGKLVARAVYGQSIDRPQYREQSNLLIYDPVENRDLQGIPAIENSRIHHADFRIEYYPKAGEIVTIGGFYKYIDRPISRFIYDFPVPQVEYHNIDYARLFGVEIEARKKFDFVEWAVVRNMSLNVNASYIWSEAVDIDETISPDPNTRRLQGTSPYLLNAGLYYENIDKGTMVSAIFNLTWDRIRDYAASSGLGNLTEGRRNQLDIIVKQRITKFMTIKAGVQNVLNQKVTFYRDADESYSYDASPDNVVFTDNNTTRGFGDYIEQQYAPGAYYSFGINFNF